MRRRSVRVVFDDRPFVRAFPRASMVFIFAAALLRAVAVMVRAMWPYRREWTLWWLFWWTWWELASFLPGSWALLATLGLSVAVLTVTRTRQVVLSWLAAGRARRRLLLAFTQTRSTDLDGRPPRVVKVASTPIGQRLWLRLLPGQSWEILDSRTEEFRAALGCRDVRMARDENRADRVTVDVVRRDSLATGIIPWADAGTDQLSLWTPVHWGVSELGEPVRLSLVERAVLIGGNRGAGKSSGMNVLVAHAAKSPDVHLLLIDANLVQLGPWRDRALAFADHRPDDAIDVVRLWHSEIDRRLELFANLPGMPLALTKEICDTYRLPAWLLVIDELAYHTAVAGTPAQQREFYNVLRDGVARGRAAGMGAIVATQRPTHDLIPTSLRDLFDIRIAYRTMTTTTSDVILGDDYARRGFSATDIDIQARGVAWMFAQGRTPVRTKTAWIPPELRAELAVSTVRFIPTSMTVDDLNRRERERDGRQP
jgi:hypothetical protein